MNRSRLLWTVLAVALFGFAALGIGKLMKESEIRKPTRELAEYGKIPPFSLIDQEGRTVTEKDYENKLWIVDMIFTTCQGTCPMMSQQMLALQRALQRTPEIKLVSVSVDPKNDTPEALAQYARFYGADTKQWTFLTGPVNSIYAIAKDGFHLPVDSVGGDQGSPIVHSERFVLIDKKGLIRGYYNGTEPETQQKILMDIGELMRQETAAN